MNFKSKLKILLPAWNHDPIMTETKSTNPLTDVPFSSLGLHPTILTGLEGAKFTHCTPIQSLTLPPALEGKDVAGQAQTGTGKTAAFLLVIFNQLLKQRSQNYGNNPRAFIVAPTRELAIQIHRDALSLGADTGLKSGLAYGGVDYEKQRKTLQDGVDIFKARVTFS